MTSLSSWIKKPPYVNLFCINKIYNEDKSLINILGLKDEIGVKIYNLRKEKNLYVFETLKENTQKLKDKSIKLEISIHTIRVYDPLENYILQCRKCHKLGHSTVACKKQIFSCSWCGKEDCSKKYDETQKMC